MAANLLTAAQAETRLIPNVQLFDGNDPDAQPEFIESLEHVFSLSTVTNAGKASLAALRFAPNSPASSWYKFNLAHKNDTYANLHLWEPEAEVPEVAAQGDEGEAGYVAAVPAIPARLGGLKKGLQTHWKPADDYQSMVKLQLENKQKPRERISAWLPRVQFNVHRLLKTEFPETFRIDADNDNKVQPAYQTVLDSKIRLILRLESNPHLQKVFDDLPVHTVTSYVEAAEKWERTDEGKKWLASGAPPSKPTTRAIRGSNNKTQKDLAGLKCAYCGIEKSHRTDECFKKRRDVEAGKIQDKVDGYPLVPVKNRRKRGGKIQATNAGNKGAEANNPNDHNPASTSTGSAHQPPPPPPNANLPALNWGGAAASVSGGDLSQLFEHQQRMAAATALAHYQQQQQFGAGPPGQQ